MVYDSTFTQMHNGGSLADIPRSTHATGTKSHNLNEKMHDSTPYQYDDLVYTRNQIRLMRVDASQDLAFEIATFDHKCEPKYFAVSYTWGASIDHERIVLNVASFQVYPNLFQLLSLLHRNKEEHWFWVDQICINQTCTAERSNQVAMMREIYSQVEKVVVWLGTGENCLRVPELLLTLQEKSLRSLEEKGKSGPGLKTTTLSRKEVATFKHKIDQSPLASQQFYENPYWYRLWIIQELLMAREIFFVCETGYCLWTLVEQVGWHLAAKFKASDSPLKVLLRAVRDNVIVMDEVFGRGPHKYIRGKCQDPRDKVYALRGLIPGIPDDIATDYGKSVEEVFQDLIVSMFETASTPKYVIVLMALCHEMLPDVWAHIQTNISIARRWTGPPIGPRDYARAIRACRPDAPVYIDISRMRSAYGIWRGNKDIWWDLIQRHV